MRKNNKIRFLAVFMVLTMLLGSVPVSAAGEELMIGSVEELREVKGITEKLAEKIREYFHC